MSKIVSILSLCFFLGACGANNHYQEQFEKGLTFYKTKKFAAAIEAFSQCILIDSNQVAARYNRGLSYDNLQEWRLAQADFEAVLRLDSTRIDAQSALAQVLFEQKKYKQAEELLRRSLQKLPANKTLQRDLIMALLHQEQTEAALEQCDRLIVLNHKNAEAYFFRGYIRAGNRQKMAKQVALQDYNEAICLDPEYLLAYYNRGVLRNELKDFRGAYDDFSQVLTLNPQYAPAYIGRGYARGGLRDETEACGDWQQALTLGHQPAQKLIEQFCNF
ncbi:MAG TPA: hypothetical protein DCM08_11130 [Microscillaceae bacterium]|jgi:tetratricopeptide (TPR) repeat protein|nr:hypothetical protein [Microscillaceae bacterium]